MLPQQVLLCLLFCSPFTLTIIFFCTPTNTRRCITLCLSWTLRMTLRARPATEGKTAVQAVSKAVSHTTGSMKALSDAPGEKQTEQSNLFTGILQTAPWFLQGEKKAPKKTTTEIDVSCCVVARFCLLLILLVSVWIKFSRCFQSWDVKKATALEAQVN